MSAKSSPSLQRVAYAPQPESTGKVIPAAGWHNQHRQAKLHQRRQMPVDGAIAAKE